MHLPSNARAVVVHRRILAVVFLLAGAGKLVGAAPMADVFAHFGLPLWFMRFIGTAEVAGALGLLVPRLAPVAAAGFALIMTGAIAEHVTHDPLGHALPPLVLLGLCVHVTWSGAPSVRLGAAAPAASSSL